MPDSCLWLRKYIFGRSPIQVKTSRGEEFRFEGISEKFTRKLYEWEERRGIRPESSTIALLGHNNNNGSNNSNGEAAKEGGGGEGEEKGRKGGGMVARSRSEGSLQVREATNRSLTIFRPLTQF